MNPENDLKEYVGQLRQRGKSDEDIQQSLNEAGYSTQMIATAFQNLQQTTQQPTAPVLEPSIVKSKLFVGLIVFASLIILAAALFVVTSVLNQNNTPSNQPVLIPGWSRKIVENNGQKFSFQYPNSWKVTRNKILESEIIIKSPNYAENEFTDGSDGKGQVKEGAGFSIELSKYGPGGIDGFKKDLEADNMRGIYQPLGVAKDITQTTISGKPAITYVGSSEFDMVAVIFPGKEYGIQFNYARPYVDLNDGNPTIVTNYKSEFYKVIGTFTLL